jgi:hypothetical protein
VKNRANGAILSHPRQWGREEPVSKMVFVNLPAPAIEALLSH